MNSVPPATFLESLVYTNLVLLRRTRHRQRAGGGAMSLAWPMYQRPRIIGAKQEGVAQESGKRANQKNPKNGHPPPPAVFKKPVN